MQTAAKRLYQDSTNLGGVTSTPGQIEIECEVVFQLSGTNGYLLRRIEGPAVTQQVLLIGVDESSQMPFGHGVATTGTPLPPGTRVRVLEAPVTNDTAASGRTIARQITGVCNEIPAPSTEFYPLWTTDIDPLDCSEYNKAMLGYTLAQGIDRLRGKPADMAPGDWGVFGMMKNNLYVGAFRTSMEGSPYAGLHMYADDSTVIFNKGLKYVEDTPAARKAEFLDVEGKSVDMEHRAASFADAAGVATNQPFTPAINQTLIAPEGTPVELTAQQPPNWEELNYGGDAVNGRIFQRVGKRTGTIPIPVVSDFTGRDGAHFKSALHSLTLSRSPEMPLLEYMKELDSEEPDSKETGTPIGDPASSIDLGGYSSMYADLLYELMRRRFAERYWPKLRSRTGEWQALSPSEVAQAWVSYVDSSILPRLPDNAPAYSDDVVSRNDPIAGEDLEMRVARLESFIHLSPTGALVLSDSVGSEIRLEGGNITVSPAVDLRLTPGRDTTVLTPRTLSMTGGTRVELNSDKGELDIHSDKNLVVSAERVLTLESRDTEGVQDASYENRGAGGGGVIVRSASSTHIIGPSIRLALQGPADKEEDGVTPYGGGAIILDGGASPVCVMGDTFSFHADREVSITAGSDGSGIVVNPNNTTIAGDSFVVVAQSCLFGGTAELEWFSAETGASLPELVSVTVKHDSDISVGLKGSLAVRKSLCSESIASINGVFTTLRAFTGREQESLYIPPKQRSIVNKNLAVYRDLDNVNITIESHAAEAIDNWYANYADDPLLTADGVRRLGIYYPDATGYMTDQSFWVTSRWQRMLKEAGGEPWIPNPVVDEDGTPMLFFPGYEMWTDTSKGFLHTWRAGADSPDDPTSLQSSWTINCTLN